MKIDSLLLLAEYFSKRKEISFCLMYEGENTGLKMKHLALFMDPRLSEGKDPCDLVRKIELEVKAVLNRQDLDFVCLNTAAESLRHRVIETSTPVFCRIERLMTDYCRKIYGEDVSRQKNFKFTSMNGISLLLAL